MADQLPPPPSPSPGSTTAATTTGTTATPSSTEETAPDSASTELDKIKRELRRLQGDFKHACVFRKDVGTSVQSDSSASAKRLFEILQQYHSHMAIMKEHAYPAIVSLGGNVNRNVYSLELAHCYRQVLEFAFENLGPAITRRQLATIPTFLKTLEKREAEMIEEEQQQANDSIIGAIDDEDDEDEERDLDGIPRRLRLAETVLRARTSRILLVLERCYDDLNQQAVLRTAECLGIQHVWTVRSFTTKCRKPARKITRGNHQWLSLRSFESTADCITALHEAHYEIWATDLSPTSECLGDDSELALPPKVAIIIGREADGVSQEMLAAASRRIFLPIYGFSESLNLSVAAALVLQKLFFMCPEARGDMPEAERSELRHLWYSRLSLNPRTRKLYLSYLANPPPPYSDQRREVRKSWSQRVLKRRREAEERHRAALASGDGSELPVRGTDDNNDNDYYDEDDADLLHPAKRHHSATIATQLPPPPSE